MLADSAVGKKAFVAALSVLKANIRDAEAARKAWDRASALPSTAAYRYADRHRALSGSGRLRGAGGFA
jgi:hypothetical protein